MRIGTYVLLKHRHTFRGGQIDLSEALGKVCDHADDDGHELVSVLFQEHGLITPSVPVDLFEVATIH